MELSSTALGTLCVWGDGRGFGHVFYNGWLLQVGRHLPDGQWVQERGVLPLCTEMTCESPPEEVRGRAETSIFGLRRSRGTLLAGGGPDRSGADQTSERKLRTVGWSHEEDILQ